MKINVLANSDPVSGRESLPITTEALFLDFDGAIVDIAYQPGDVVVPDELVDLLERLHGALGGALAIVTGRTIADVDRYLAPLKLVVAGVHGADLRLDGGDAEHITERRLDSDIRAAVVRLALTVEGVTVEDKGPSIALHYRAVPTVAPFLEAELRQILAEKSGEMALLRGRRILEVVPRHVSKGEAIRRISALPAFRNRRPIMIGGDISDETAFEVAEQMGGMALRVAGEHFTDELADFSGPAQVRTWLAALVEGGRA